MTKRAAYKPPVGLRPNVLWGQECADAITRQQVQHAAETNAMQVRHAAEYTEQNNSLKAARRREVAAAIQRYVDADHKVPAAWIEELQNLQVGLP